MTPDFALYISAITIGLLGSSHCIAMCGGITSALSLSLEKQKPGTVFALILSYHTGRIFSYACAGFLLASIGWFIGDISKPIYSSLRYLAGGMLVAMGLYVSGWWRGLTQLEKAGHHLWKRIQPLAKNILPIRHPGQALGVGMLWGWLPCGLVYSSLIWASSQGSPVQGAILMACFGLGTLPTVILTGAFSRQVNGLIQSQLTRNIAGLLLILFGLWTIPGPHQMKFMMIFGGMHH